MSLRNDYVTGEELPAVDVNDIVTATITNTHNIYELYLENYYASLATPSTGLFFDGFSDTSKIDDTVSAITAPATSGQANVTVANGASFLANQEVDIFDTTTGKLETKVISSILANVLTMVGNLTNSYTTAGFVTRSSVDLNTGVRTITVQPELLYGIYRGNKVQLQQAVQTARTWVTRKLEDLLNRWLIGAGVSVGSTTITISGDYSSYISNGNTIDISNATNTVRERKVLTSAPTYGGGFTTLTFAGQGIVNASGFTTTGYIERIDILPQVSIVASGANENFQAMTFKGATVDFTALEVEDSYEYDAGSPYNDLVFKLILN